MSSSHRMFLQVTTATLIALMFCGCSGRTRVAQMIESANREYEAGQYDEAEIAYKNVLKKDPEAPAAIAGLGLIYHDQGREARAFPMLSKAAELQPDNVNVRLKIGLVHLAAGAMKEAREAAAFVLERRPNDEHAALLLVEATGSKPEEIAEARQRLSSLAQGAAVVAGLGILELRENRVANAEAAFKNAQALNPNSVAAATAIGMLKWAQKDLPGADAALKQAAELSPIRSPQRLKYVQFKLQTGDKAGGKELLEKLSRDAPDYLPAWVWQAEVAAMEKNYEQSGAFLAKALARDPLHPEAIILGARVAEAKGETARAVSELEKLHAVFPQSPQVSYQLGLAHAANGENGKAMARLSSAVAAAPGMSQAVLALAEINIRQRDYESAITSLKQLIQHRPDIPMAHALLAEAHRGQGNPDEAMAIYSKLEAQFPADPQAPYWRGMLLLQQGKADEARSAFERAHELAPKSIGALEQLVGLDIWNKQYAAAQARVEAELKSRPNTAELHLLLAKILLAQNDRNTAEVVLKHAATLDPQSPVPPFMLGQMYAAQNDFEKALSSLEQVAKQRPKHTAAWQLIGAIQDRLKNYTAAREAYEKTVELDPKNAVALNNLAFLYAERLNQNDRAYELAQRARTLLPQEPRAADTLGWILSRKKQYSQALGLLRDSAAKLPDEPEVQFHLGMTHYLAGDEEPARVALQRALEIDAKFDKADEARRAIEVLKIDPANAGPDQRKTLETRIAERPDDPVALIRLADIYQHQGDTEKAIAAYRKAIEANPKNAKALLNVARLHGAKKDLPRALEAAKAARAIAPQDPAIAHTVGRLAFQLGDHRWAESVLNEAHKLRPDDAEMLFDWATAAYSVGRVSDAEAAMQQALQTGPGFSRAAEARQFLDFVSAATKPAPTPEFLKLTDQALSADPANVAALMVLAKSRQQASDIDGAKQAYERVLSRYPDFTPAQRELTLLYANGGPFTEKTTTIATKARQAFPTDTDVARAVGIIAYRQGEFSKAASLLQQATAREKADGEAMYYLGMAQWQLNRRTDGRVSLQRALDLGVGEALAVEARKNLATQEK